MCVCVMWGCERETSVHNVCDVLRGKNCSTCVQQLKCRKCVFTVCVLSEYTNPHAHDLTIRSVLCRHTPYRVHIL